MRDHLHHRAALQIAILGAIAVGTALTCGCAGAPAATPTPTTVLTTPTIAAMGTPAAGGGGVGTATAAETVAATLSPSAGTPTTISVTATPTADAQAGIQAMATFDCGSCHTIPGVQGANGTAGPSLAGYASKPQVLGQVAKTPVPNTLANTARYIENPAQVVSASTMPNLQVPPTEARNMAAYLETLK